MNEACFPLNGWEVVQRNVGIVWEDSPGLGLTSSTDDEQGGECGFSLWRSNLADSRTASVIASEEPQKEAWLKFGLRSPLARFWQRDTSQELHNQMFFIIIPFLSQVQLPLELLRLHRCITTFAKILGQALLIGTVEIYNIVYDDKT